MCDRIYGTGSWLSGSMGQDLYDRLPWDRIPGPVSGSGPRGEERAYVGCIAVRYACVVNVAHRYSTVKYSQVSFLSPQTSPSPNPIRIPSVRPASTKTQDREQPPVRPCPPITDQRSGSRALHTPHMIRSAGEGGLRTVIVIFFSVQC